MIKKTIIAIGGGEIKSKTTLKIDEYIANLAKQRAKGERARALFIGTASHDFMPYFNSFRKTYTSVFDIKADVAQTVFRQTEYERLKEKIQMADMIYIGGGDTKFMIDSWGQSGLKQLVLEAYNNGTIIAGLSAGAICWFENMYTDSYLTRGEANEYRFHKGIGLLKGTACPHYNLRKADYDKALKNFNDTFFYAIEDNSAIVFENGVYKESISSNGKAYKIEKIEDGVKFIEI
jgi:dipeptidase E